MLTDEILAFYRQLLYEPISATDSPEEKGRKMKHNAHLESFITLVRNGLDNN